MNILKRDRIISVANLQAFGSVYYSEEEDKLLLIKKNNNENSEKETFFTKLKKAFCVLTGLLSKNTPILISCVLLIMINFFYPIGIDYAIQNGAQTTFYTYIPFYLISVLTGYAIAKNVFNLVHNVIQSSENFKEIVVIDDDISGALKKKLKKDIFYAAVLTFLSVGSLICFPHKNVSYITTYVNFMPVSATSFITIEVCIAILTFTWSCSPIGLKIKSYKKVKQLNNVENK